MYKLDATGNHSIPAACKTYLSNGVLVGTVVGPLLAGIVGEKYGCRRTMIAAMLVMNGVILILILR